MKQPASKCEFILANQTNQTEIMHMLFQAVEQSTNIILITDRHGKIEYVNPQFCLVTGYSAAEALGQTPRILKSGELDDSVYHNLWQTIGTGQRWTGEFHNKTKSGAYYWALATISPVKNEAGEVTHLLGIQDDISQQKLFEQQLLQKNKELEEMIHQLYQTQGTLIHQEKMAGLGQLAAGVAHEINNPLGFIMSNLNTLQNYVTKISEMVELGCQLRHHVVTQNIALARQLAEQMEQQSQSTQLAFILEDLPALFKESGDGMERVGRIVKSLRAFARIDADGDRSDYDLVDGIHNTLTIAGSEIKYTAQIVTHLTPVIAVPASGGEINQVLLNILMNAVQAIKTTSTDALGQISLTTWQEEHFVCCSIADTGGGIAPAILTQIFNPFFTTKPVGEGTGLGLSISYDIIVNKHKGQLWAESQVDQGTTFYLKLPIY